MSLWGIGNLVLLIVIVPVLVALLNAVLGPLETIRGAVSFHIGRAAAGHRLMAYSDLVST